MDPERLIHGGSSDEAALLRSAAREGPSIGSRARTLAMLGVATGVIAATATATTAATAATAASSQIASGSGIAGATGFATIAKWMGIGIASTAVVVGSAYQVRSTFDDAGYIGTRPSTVQVEAADALPNVLPSPQESSVSHAAPVEAVEPVAEEPAVEEKPIAPAPPPVTPLALPAKHVTASPVAPALAQAKSIGPSLADEVASLDAARTALANGEAGAAEALLAGHGAKFKQGALAPEARVLAVEVLAQSGRYAEAIASADAFLVEYPSSPHRTRLQSVTATCRAALAPPP